jgi:ABC-2 type transport system permease protein
MSSSAQTMVAPVAPPKINGLGRLVRDTWTLYRRAIIQMTRTPTQLYFSIIQPLIWFLLFGQVFSRLTTGFQSGPVPAGATNPVTAQFGTDNYQAFFLPAIIVQMVLFGATGSALGIITDDLSGYLNKLRVAPINRFAILIGGLLANLTRMLLQTTLLLVIGIVFGVRPEYWYLLPLILVFVALFGLVIGGLGLIIGLRTRNVQSTFLLVNFFTLPLFFTSSAQLPITFLPDWLQTIAHFNPLTYAINGCRVIITGLNKSQIDNGDTVFSVLASAGGILIVLSVIVLTFATRIFSKQIAK